MPRTSKFVSYSEDKDDIMKEIELYLISQSFIKTGYKGETGFYYSKGKGVWQAKRMIRILSKDDTIIVEAFIDMMGAESGLQGVIGSLPKKNLRIVMDEVIRIIESKVKRYSDFGNF